MSRLVRDLAAGAVLIFFRALLKRVENDIEEAKLAADPSCIDESYRKYKVVKNDTRQQQQGESGARALLRQARVRAQSS